MYKNGFFNQYTNQFSWKFLDFAIFNANNCKNQVFYHHLHSYHLTPWLIPIDYKLTKKVHIFPVIQT